MLTVFAWQLHIFNPASSKQLPKQSTALFPCFPVLHLSCRLSGVSSFWLTPGHQNFRAITAEAREITKMAKNVEEFFGNIFGITGFGIEILIQWNWMMEIEDLKPAYKGVYLGRIPISRRLLIAYLHSRLYNFSSKEFTFNQAFGGFNTNQRKFAQRLNLFEIVF